MPLGFSTHTAAAPQREASPPDQATRRWTSASPQPGEAAIGPGSAILSPPARPRRRSAAPPAPIPASGEPAPCPPPGSRHKGGPRSTSRGDAAPDPMCPQLRREPDEICGRSRSWGRWLQIGASRFFLKTTPEEAEFSGLCPVPSLPTLLWVGVGTLKK